MLQLAVPMPPMLMLTVQLVVCITHIAAGFMVGRKAEAGGIAKDGAKMVMAVANARVRRCGKCGSCVNYLCTVQSGPRQVVAGLWRWQIQ